MEKGDLAHLSEKKKKEEPRRSPLVDEKREGGKGGKVITRPQFLLDLDGGRRKEKKKGGSFPQPRCGSPRKKKVVFDFVPRKRRREASLPEIRKARPEHLLLGRNWGLTFNPRPGGTLIVPGGGFTTEKGKPQKTTLCCCGRRRKNSSSISAR